jgi:serine/threonine protein kinase
MTTLMSDQSLQLKLQSMNHMSEADYVKTLGTGGCGVVSLYQCRHKDAEQPSVCNECFVVKQINIASLYQGSDVILRYDTLKDMFINEYNIASQLQHPNIIKVFDIDMEMDAIVLEYIVGLDLLDYLNTYSCDNASYLINCLYKIVDAVEYMHNIGIAHCDIKLENILMDMTNTNVKLIDFGHATTFIENDKIQYVRGTCGTEGYFPPESYTGALYNPSKVDVWCLGVVLYNVIYDAMPWQHACIDKDSTYASCARYFERGKLHPIYFGYDTVVLQGLTRQDHGIIQEIFLKTFRINSKERADIGEIKRLFSQLSVTKNVV